MGGREGGSGIALNYNRSVADVRSEAVRAGEIERGDRTKALISSRVT